MSFSLGDEVTAIFKVSEGGKRGYRGNIAAIKANGMYTVHFHDGDIEDVHAQHITPFVLKKKLHDNTTPEEPNKRTKRM